MNAVNQNHRPWNHGANFLAILAGSVTAVAATAGTAAAPSTTTVDDATTSKPETKEETKEVKEEDKENEDSDVAVPLEKTVLDQFTADMLQGCLEVLTGMPGTVFKACDVLSAVAQRNGKEWKERTMMHILKQVFEQYFSAALLMSLSSNTSLYGLK